MLAVSLVVLLGGSLAAAAPGHGTSARSTPGPPTAQVCPPGAHLPFCGNSAPSPTTTGGVPLAIAIAPTTLAACTPAALQSECHDPSTAAFPTVPTSVPPCAGPGCSPQSTTSIPAASDPGTGQLSGNDGSGQTECGINNVGGCVLNAINDFFRGVVDDALNPLLSLLSATLLTTPTPDELPRIGELWNSSWQILLACYAMLILIAGIVLMSYETLQTHYGVKEIAPRIVVGFVAGALSLWVATQAIDLANALAQAVMGGGLDANSAGQTLRNLVLGPLNGGIFIIFMSLFVAGMLVVLLVSYIVRVALTFILIAGAPIALMAHALPQTEGIAYWWWKAFGGCLAIQVVQSLTLITALKVFLAPGGFTLFGPTSSGLVNLLVALALFYILIKIPFWCLGSLRGGRSRSMVGSIVRGFIAYKTFGLLRGRGGGGGGPRPSSGPRPRPNPSPNHGGPRGRRRRPSAHQQPPPKRP